MFYFKPTNFSLIVLSGLPRAGKSFFTKYVSSVSSDGLFNIDYLIETFSHLQTTQDLSDETFKFLLKYAITQHVFEKQLGRRWNLRPNEESSIFASENIERLISRLFQHSSDLERELNAEKTTQSLLLHSAASYSTTLFDAFPDLTFLNIFSHPYNVFKAWMDKGYGDDQYYRQPRQLAIPLIEFSGKILPIYASGWEREYLDATPSLRVLGMLKRLFQADHNGLISLSQRQRSKTFLICYEDCVDNLDNTSSKLEEILNTKSDTKLCDTIDPNQLNNRLALSKQSLSEFSIFYRNLSRIEKSVFDELLEVYQHWQQQKI